METTLNNKRAGLVAAALFALAQAGFSQAAERSGTVLLTIPTPGAVSVTVGAVASPASVTVKV